MGCNVGYEKSGALCYPVCKEGYYGIATTCWGECGANMTNHDVFCTGNKNYTQYGSNWSSKEKCETSDPRGIRNGCFHSADLFWYPNCDPGLHSYGCCECNMNCPNTTITDDFVRTCTKRSYTRGAGVIPNYWDAIKSFLIYALIFFVIFFIIVYIIYKSI